MALSGMTGFSRVEGALGAWTWAVEARSVNGRNLEARFKAPAGLEALDKVVRDAAAARFQRGQINVSLQARKAEGSVQARIDTEQLDRYLDLALAYAESRKVAPPRIEALMGLRGVIEASEEIETPEARAQLEAALTISLVATLDALKASRLEEGAALTPVLTGVVGRIEGLLGAAEQEAAMQPAFLKERYERRMAELIGQGGYEERVVQEAAMLAVKADVREELDRLKNHVAAARALLAAEGPSGRRLDFLAQEFMREANTLCSKSATNGLTATGLELKAAVEQLREQVQNVE
jgi:uncharacterized protein (TIGR00255 family)